MKGDCFPSPSSLLKFPIKCKVNDTREVTLAQATRKLKNIRGRKFQEKTNKLNFSRKENRINSDFQVRSSLSQLSLPLLFHSLESMPTKFPGARFQHILYGSLHLHSVTHVLQMWMRMNSLFDKIPG